MRKRFEVVVFSCESLTLEMICLLLRNDDRVRIAGRTGDRTDLLEMTGRLAPDVALLCLSKKGRKTIKLIPRMLELSPKTRVLVLSGETRDEQYADALENGAAGVLPKEQCGELLFDALAKVCSGETWMNEKILKQLVGKLNKNKNGELKTDQASRVRFLTERELEVIGLVCLGLKNKEIAARLGVRGATVRHHLGSVYSKLHVNDRLNLVIYAYKHRLIGAPDAGVATNGCFHE